MATVTGGDRGGVKLAVIRWLAHGDSGAEAVRVTVVMVWAVL